MEKEDKIRLQKAIEKSLGEQWEVKPITVPKVNGPRDGLRCRHEGDKHALVIYPDDYAGMLASGESMADIGRYAAGLVEERGQPCRKSRTCHPRRTSGKDCSSSW